MTQHAQMRKKLVRNLIVFGVALVFVVLGLFSLHAYAVTPDITIDFQTGDGDGMDIIDLLILFVLLALLPSILLMMTCFTRIIVVFSFMRNALGTQQSPPNQILIGLALCLTLFIMAPVLEAVQTDAYEPYRAGEITREEAIETAQVPIKQFMIRNTSYKSLNLFLTIANDPAVDTITPETPAEELEDLNLFVLISAFVTSELERAFWIGFLLYLPFLIIDIVVSSILMSMGMMMLPPAMISLPFKILMFVLVDGWGLLMGTLVQGIQITA